MSKTNVQTAPNIKSAQKIYWNLADLEFQISRSRF